MLKEEIRAGISVFLKNHGERTFEFDTSCPLEERVPFIHSVLFPGAALALFYFRFAFGRLAGWIDYSPLKVFIYRLMGFKIGEGVFISPGVFLDPHFPGLIELQSHCIIGQEAIVSCHEYSGYHYRLGRVTVGRGAVVGHGAVIMPGTALPPMTCLPMRTVVGKNTPLVGFYDFSEKFR